MDVDFTGSCIRFSAGNGLFIPSGPKSRHKASVLTDVVRLILVEDAERMHISQANQGASL